ncbi:MAG: sulfur oxidation c-type cytochrome SoxX [Gammaproteobacteria bacterium]|nr:sulfur oxidation c-type cytochrome SoxX [Gammaproteobacteria bacterium]MBU1647055.1 sulfur oxidation c-type cytochrome SoxX [Gammaproteobacteria bacterium]MBU1972567.1 sulfur oxidation c-type cytochrome SoxX [Gammaproteobacteria bacterium]
MNKRHQFSILAAIAATAAIAAAPAFADSSHRAKAMTMMKADFTTKGQATADRIYEDGLQAVCNRSGNHPPEKIAKQLEGDQMATVKYPADGKLMGDWKAGEKLAQSGRGFTWNDAPGSPAGGNCYNCHQIAPSESSFGTVGPSLFNFGKLRGNTAENQKYVYSKIYNAKSYNLCSEMPRFGHVGALGEKQIKDLVALLLDPESPVNK